MFENLDQDKKQNSGGSNIPPPANSIPAPVLSAPAPAKVEDMFASVKDASPAAAKKSIGSVAVPVENKKSSKSGMGAIIGVIIFLIIVCLGGFLAVKFLGIDVSDPSSWGGKLSGLSSLFAKQQPSQTIIVNNEPITPVTNQNKAEEKNNSAAPVSSTTVASPVPTTPNPATAIIATTTASSSKPLVATSAPVSLTPNQKTAESAIDSDNDGLADVEEVALGTNPLLADTDGDTYSDKTEVDNSYNPLGAGDISQDPNIIKYTNTKQGYSVLYPKSFTIQDVLNNNGSVILFSAPANYTVQVSVQPNVMKQDILTYFNQQFPENKAKSSDIINKNNLQGLFSPDKNKYYAIDASDSKIYTVSYTSYLSSAEGGSLADYDIFLVAVHSLAETDK
jgi:hypothetical protein